MKHPNAKWLYYVLGSKYILKEHIPTLLTFFPEKSPLILFRSACLNPNLTFDDLIDLFGEELSLNYAYQCPYFTFTDFQKHIISKGKLPLTTWKHLTYFHDILPIEFIKEHLFERWDWLAILQYNKTITYDQFNEIPKNIFPDTSIKINEWHIRHRLFDNKHLSHFDKKRILEDLLASPISGPMYHLDNGDGHLVISPLFLEPTLQEIKDYFAKKRIIRIIVEIMTNPSYLQCRKRLTREYSGLHRSNNSS